MKIKLEQIKGTLREKVDNAISQLQVDGNTIIAYFCFNDVDHQYSWRSKGKYIAIRYTTPNCEFQQYHDKPVYFEKKKK
jgi:predicted metallopeptidase